MNVLALKQILIIKYKVLRSFRYHISAKSRKPRSRNTGPPAPETAHPKMIATLNALVSVDQLIQLGILVAVILLSSLVYVLGAGQIKSSSSSSLLDETNDQQQKKRAKATATPKAAKKKPVAVAATTAVDPPKAQSPQVVAEVRKISQVYFFWGLLLLLF